jgi:hypothetical protein
MSLLTTIRADPTLELPYYSRAFAQTTNLPQYGNGGNYGLAQAVDHESTLVFPWGTSAPRGCTDTIQFDPDLIFDPQITRWQQDDYRPVHFESGTRFAVKNTCIQPPARFRYLTQQEFGGATNDFVQMYADSDI